MTRWTEANTEGFTPAELVVMNEAQAIIETVNPAMDPQSIADRLNNAFIPGITVDELVAKAGMKQ